MFPKLVAGLLLVAAIMYGLYRHTGDYQYLAEDDSIKEYPGEVLFNIPVSSGRLGNNALTIEFPFVGVTAVHYQPEQEEALLRAKSCGRLKVRVNREDVDVFEGSGCFLDW